MKMSPKGVPVVFVRPTWDIDQSTGDTSATLCRREAVKTFLNTRDVEPPDEVGRQFGVSEAGKYKVDGGGRAGAGAGTNLIVKHQHPRKTSLDD